MAVTKILDHIEAVIERLEIGCVLPANTPDVLDRAMDAARGGELTHAMGLINPFLTSPPGPAIEGPKPDAKRLRTRLETLRKVLVA